MQNALVTGANGFIGRALCQELHCRGINIHAAIRSETPERLIPFCTLYAVGDINDSTDWQQALAGVDTVFHLAGTVHQPYNNDHNIYFNSIVAATKKLVEQCIQQGVKRFIYISTTKVYGLENSPRAIKESDPCNPTDVYGKNKLAAEQVLRDLTKNSSLEWVIIRPALVYGPQARGNFQRLVKLVKFTPALPFGQATSPRSLVALDNLVHFILTCATTPAADHQTFNITDGNDISTAQICTLIAKNLNKKRFLMPVPRSWFAAILKLFGKEEMVDKLFGKLCYDVSRARQLINWKPVVTVEDAIKKAL